MAREPEDLAEMCRALGAQLAIFRVAAELTQGQVAQAAFCDRTNVAHIEKGRSRGDERFWTIADELCGADGSPDRISRGGSGEAGRKPVRAPGPPRHGLVPRTTPASPV